MLSVGWDHRQLCRPTAEEPEEAAARSSLHWASREWQKRPGEQTEAVVEVAPSRHGRWSKAKAAQEEREEQEEQEERAARAAVLLLPCSAGLALL